MEFSPKNAIVRRCLQGMAMEEKGETKEAIQLFFLAWEEAKNDFEKFLAAHYVSRHQKNVTDQLEWLETSLSYALKVNDHTVTSAFPSLYLNIAKCYENLGDLDKAKEYLALATAFKNKPADAGPFYHGTKANLQKGDLLIAGNTSNYKPGLTMNHIYFTAMVNGAGLAAALAKGIERERVYIIEPTGRFENDPNVTDKKFPGNPTRSYRTDAPLKIVGEVKDWERQTPDDVQQWRERLANNKGEIIN